MNENDMNALSGIDVLAGKVNLDARPLGAFDETILDFLDTLSKKLLRDPQARMHSDVISFAYWCRRSNLESKKARHENDGLRMGRGLAFHIAPANVPVNFAFSFAFSVLAGNANIVRVPSKDFPQVTALCSCIAAVMEDYPEIERCNAFVRYPSTSSLTETFSAHADARIIWGGDATVEHIRSLPSRPRCVDVVFSDRYSLAVMDAQMIADASDEVVADLAKDFFNDTYLMDQNACSSPMLIAWINDAVAGRDRFWKAVSAYAHNHYELQDALSVDKYVKLCEDALEGIVGDPAVAFDGYLSHVSVTDYLEYMTDDQADICTLRAKGGYFYEAAIPSLDNLVGLLDERVQTIVYFGDESLACEISNALVKVRSKGVDRIVPVGKAMDIDLIWDGYDLITSLSRIVSVR